MKKLMTFAACLLTMLACANKNDDKVIKVEKLPQEAQSFIDQHFEDKNIALVKEDNEIIGKTYEIIFSNGDEVEFDKNGNWKEVNCKYSEVPSTIIPDFIHTFIKTNYPDDKIIKIERDEKEYEVELNNDIERKFPRENMTEIKVSDLPKNAQEFINQHFKNEQINFIQKERNFLGDEYEVIFTNGNKVEFDKNGEWEEVDCKFSQVPDAIIPQAIKSDIAQRYPQAKVLEIDRDARGYDVKLDNRLELEYNNNFEFVDID